MAGTSGFSFEATDQSSNVFNPGDIASRAFGGIGTGNLSFGITGNQIVLIVGMLALAGGVVWFLAHKGRP